MKRPPPAIAEKFKEAPPRIRERLLTLRQLILAAAEAEQVGPLEETLKWGEPAFLPRRPRVGTAIRLGWSDGTPARVSLYVHCQTTLVDSYRERFPDAGVYEANRAVHFSLDTELPEDVLQQMAALALTYHRGKAQS